MTKDELRAKYARIPTDFSQIELLKNQLIDSGVLEVAQINPENAGKALVFGDDGTITVGEAGGSGGVELPVLRFDNVNAKLSDLTNALGYTSGTKDYACELIIAGILYGTGFVRIVGRGGPYITIDFIGLGTGDTPSDNFYFKRTVLSDGVSIDNLSTTALSPQPTIVIPYLPNDAASKTYVFIAENSVFKWVEASSGGGTQWYIHVITFSTQHTFCFISDKQDPLDLIYDKFTLAQIFNNGVYGTIGTYHAYIALYNYAGGPSTIYPKSAMIDPSKTYVGLAYIGSGENKLLLRTYSANTVDISTGVINARTYTDGNEVTFTDTVTKL